MDKVTLFDANDAKIGDAHPRRARQLVKKQRAVWVDESEQAIRFYAGMEHQANDEDDDEIDTLVELFEAIESVCGSDDASAVGADARVSKVTGYFVLHSIATCLIWIFGIFLANTILPSRVPTWHVMVVPAVVMVTGYLTHVGHFASTVFSGGGVATGGAATTKALRAAKMAELLRKQLKK